MQITSNIVGIDHGLVAPVDTATAAPVTDQEQDQRMDAFLKACAETFGVSGGGAEDSGPRQVSSSHMSISESEMRMLRQMFDARFAALEARIKDQMARDVADVQARVIDRLAGQDARSNATPKTSVKSG